MERLADDMLLLAQLDEGSPTIRGRPPCDRSSPMPSPGLAGGLDRSSRSRPARGLFPPIRDRITQVLRNLFRNPAEHTSPGRCHQGHRDGAGRTPGWRSSSLTTAPASPPADRERIFVRFHRVERARDRQTGGTRAWTRDRRAIVEAHGGRIWADDAAGGRRSDHVPAAGIPARRRLATGPRSGFPDFSQSFLGFG